MEHVTQLQPAGRRPDRDPIQVGAAGAAQVADHPAPPGDGHFRVLTAHRGVVQNYVQVLRPPEAKEVGRLPPQPLEFGPDTGKYDARVWHADLPDRILPTPEGRSLAPKS